jgi:hypothetical protein
MRAFRLRSGQAFIATLLLLPALALADDATQLRIDHAVYSSDHVVRGRYEGGRLEVDEELKGKLPSKVVALERDEVELKDEELAPGAIHMKGKGVFFLLDRFGGSGADAKRFMEWEAVEGVAWEGSVSFLRYKATDDDKQALVEIAKREDFQAALLEALELDGKLAKAIAMVDTYGRVQTLKKLVLTVDLRPAPEALVKELGPDPFAQRALIELGHSGALDALEHIRSSAKPESAWMKAAAVRAMAPAKGALEKLEKIASSKESSEDEVVAAIEMIFSFDDKGLATLEHLSWDERPRVRKAVAAALREKVQDLKVLMRLMEDKDAGVRVAATEAAKAAARRLGVELPEGK